MSVANIGGIHFPLRLYGVHVIAIVGGMPPTCKYWDKCFFVPFVGV